MNIKNISSKIKSFNLKESIVNYYETYVLPNQSIDMLTLKRREFKEKTKYLNIKELNNMTEEEKKDLRAKGYFVDLTDDTIRKIKQFNLTYDRHKGRYNIFMPNYNRDFFQDNYNFTHKEYMIQDYNYKSKYRRFNFLFSKFFKFCFIFALIIYIGKDTTK